MSFTNYLICLLACLSININTLNASASFTYSLTGFDNICEGECGSSDMLLSFFGGTAPYTFTLNINGAAVAPITTISFSNNIQICADLTAGNIEINSTQIRVNPAFFPLINVSVNEVSDAMNCVGTSVGDLATYNFYQTPTNNAPAEFTFTTNNNVIDLTLMESEIGSTNVTYYSDANLFTEISIPEVYDYILSGNMVWVQTFDGLCYSEGKTVELIVDLVNNKEVEIPEFEIYPVPTFEVLNLDVPPKIKSLKIYTSAGVLVHSSSQATDLSRLNVSFLNPGSYVISFYDSEDRIRTMNFIKN